MLEMTEFIKLVESGFVFPALLFIFWKSANKEKQKLMSIAEKRENELLAQAEKRESKLMQYLEAKTKTDNEIVITLREMCLRLKTVEQFIFQHQKN